jgi:diguanylate cyclase (GGDEF)-like protein/PAS domain S-box-containing protein
MKTSLQVLFIEDSQDDAFLIQRELQRGGFTITSQRVDTIPAMRNALENHAWDVIISDFNLPGFDGLRVLKVFKSYGYDTPFILISGAVGEEIAVDAMKAGAHDYIKKDNLSRLVPAIERELREAVIRNERLRVKEMLNLSETRYKTLVENIPIGVYRCEPDYPGRILMANPAFLSMFGITTSIEMHPINMADFYFDVKDQARFSKKLIGQGKIIAEEWLFRKNDGTPIWGKVTAQIGQEGQEKTSYFDCTIEDITSRRKAQKLQEALYQIAQAINTTQTLDELIHQIHKVVKSLMNAPNFFLALYDGETKTISFPYFIDEVDHDSSPINLGKGLTSLIIESGESLLVTPEEYKRMIFDGIINPVGATPIDWLGVPLKNRENKVIGALVVQSYSERSRYNEDDRNVLTFVSSQVAIAIESRQTEKQMEEQRALLRQVIDVNPNFIYAKDREGRFRMANHSVAQAYGTNVENLIGKTEMDFNLNLQEVERFRKDDLEVLTTLQEKFIEEESVTDSSGNIRRMQTIKLPLAIPGQKDVHVLGVSTDITYTFQDSLTNLPNRRVFLDRLGRALNRSRRHGESYSAVLMLDLDRFAMINESFGHTMGDDLLIQVAHRLVTCLRTADTISRITGDEFAILLEDLESVNSITQIADRILEEISLPFQLQGQKVVLTASIGIVLCSPDYTSESALRDADVALHRAKAAGKARYELFTETMRESVRNSFQIETDLRQAIQQNELQLYFEPIVSLQTGKVISLEALLRWNNPDRGLIYPNIFIPIAEETGLILQIGDWVIRESCRLIKNWQKKYSAAKDLAVSVNLSTIQFLQGDLIQRIERALQEANLDASYLQLEITESVIIKNEIQVIEVLERLKSMGIKVQMDDFGTGYSSLNYLHRLPFNAIKIDRSFISGQGNQLAGIEIVRTIINLANDLHLETIAEGVESQEQLMRLRELGCNAVQGFLFTKSMPVDTTETFLNSKGARFDWLEESYC